ncbi:MAG: hypothetical protein Q8O67_29850 [Deltaproteobacteria bacterium]|nr:hypothetical protein [Deltaproteobacteria bacterium]
MSWNVDGKSQTGLLRLRLEGKLSVADIKSFVVAHNTAIDSFDGEYRVLVDMRGLMPLSPEAADAFEGCKRYSSGHPGFRGSAALVDSKLVALQQQRTSERSGVMSTELITDDEAAAAAHLTRVSR